jgi:hypothetical protein
MLTSTSDERANKPIALSPTCATKALFSSFCAAINSAKKYSPNVSVNTSDCALNTAAKSS